MQLIYIYANVRSRNINTEINFDSPYQLRSNIENQSLEITKKEQFNRIEGLYASNINNFDVIVGKNGLGKSTVLELIGLKREDMKELWSDEWLLVYLDDSPNGSTSFYVEGHRFPVCTIKTIIFQEKKYDLSHFDNEYITKININEDEQIYDLRPVLQKINYKNAIYSLSPNPTPFDDVFLSKSNSSRKSDFKYEVCTRNYLKYDYISIFTLMNSRNFDLLGFKNLNKKLYINISPTLNNINHTNDAIFDIFANHQLVSKYYRTSILYDDPFFDDYENYITRLMTNYIFSFAWNSFYVTSWHEKRKINFNELNSWLDSNLLRFDVSKFQDRYNLFKEILENFRNELDGSNQAVGSINCFFDLLEKIKLFYENKDMEMIDRRTASISISIIKDKLNREDALLLLKILWRTNHDSSGKYDYGIHCCFEGLSSGEISIINTLSSLSNIPNKSNKAIILLDEPDCSLHPEWARQFVYILCKYLKHRRNRFDIIMTTHSPLTVSDFFTETIHFLDNTKDISCNTFCGNIGDILVNQFFIERPFGEFAFNTIQNYLKKLEENKQLNEKDIKDFLYLIDNVGDVVMKKSLKYYFNQWLKDNKPAIANSQLIEMKKHQIKELEEEIRNLGGNV